MHCIAAKSIEELRFIAYFVHGHATLRAFGGLKGLGTQGLKLCVGPTAYGGQEQEDNA